MLLGPIFSLEMLTSARRVRYFVVRGLYAAILLFDLFIVRHDCFRSYDTPDMATVARFSSAFFTSFAILQILAVLLLGPAMAAATIAGERERRTIEYLFASPLRSSEILLGKLAARLIHMIVLVLVGVPVLALAMLQGGIAPQAIAALTVITASTAVTVAAVSMAVSVWSARARDAVIRAYLVLAALIVVPWILEEVVSHFPSPIASFVEYVLKPFLAANPLNVLEDALMQRRSATVGASWTVVGTLVLCQLIVAAASLAAAFFAIRRVHLRQMGAAPRRRRRWPQLIRPAIGQAPMMWKELFAESAAARLGILGWTALGLLLACALGIVAYNFWELIADTSPGPSYLGKDWRLRDYLGMTTVIGTLTASGILLLVAARAAGSITAEKERQCWDSLMSTPLGAHEIVWAKLLGNLWAVRGLVLVLFAIWGLAALVSPEFLVATPFLIGTFLLMALFVSAVGVTFSLHLRTSMRAMAATLTVLLIIGGGYLFCCIPVMDGPGRSAEIVLAACIPFLLAFPGIATVEDVFTRHEAVVPAAYVLGMLCYLAATVILIAVLIESFDRNAGRADWNESAGRRRLGANGRSWQDLELIPEPTREAAQQELRDGSAKGS